MLCKSEGKILKFDFEENPLGPADATGRGQEDLGRSYVDVTNIFPAIDRRHLAQQAVVVGDKGSGKTHLLRHIATESQGAGRRVEWNSLNNSAEIVEAARYYRGNDPLEASISLWEKIWRLAFAISTISVFTAKISDPRATKRVADLAEYASLPNPADAKARLIVDLVEEHGGIIPNDRYPSSAIEALTSIVRRYKNRQAIKEVIGRVSFERLEKDVARLTHGFLDIHYFVDGIDEFSWADPVSWLEVQLGLFRLAFLQGNTRHYGESFRLTVSLRSHIFYRAKQEPHNDRFRDAATRLTWNKKTAAGFLLTTLNRNANGRFARAEKLMGDRPLATWLDFDEVTPTGRNFKENVEEYFLRHTRFCPRNIVESFNHLANMQNAAVREGGLITPHEFKYHVSHAAIEVGRDLLAMATEEAILLTHGTLNPKVPERGQSREYSVSIFNQAFKRAILMCSREVIERNELVENLLLAFDEDFVISGAPGRTSDALLQALWRGGVFAYPIKGTDGKASWQFVWSTNEHDVIHVPNAATAIGFHTTMIDVCGLKVVSDDPIY
jgi:hypothetical protein